MTELPLPTLTHALAKAAATSHGVNFIAGEAKERRVPYSHLRERALGVEFSGELAVAYRACLESRVASRVFLVVADFVADTDAAFYDAARAIDWRAHVDPARTLACDFTGKHPEITHTRFGALRLKDGICDQLRDATIKGKRITIRRERPAAPDAA